MIMTSIFVFMFLAIMYVWLEQRKKAITFFIASSVLAIASFIHHITDIIGLSL